MFISTELLTILLWGNDMDKRLIQSMDLNNHQVLKIYDASRKITGGRWFITMISEIEITVDETAFAGCEGSLPDISDIRNALGVTVTFEQKRERVFIDEKEKDRVLKEVCDFFLDSSLSYLSHADFPGKFILRQYDQYRKKQAWYQE